MQVELPTSKIKVELIEKLGWGLRQKIKAVMLGDIGVDANKADHATITGEALYNAKVKAMELCIVKMTAEPAGEETVGKEIKFSEAWLDQLDEEDGEALYDAVDAIAQTAKKA